MRNIHYNGKKNLIHQQLKLMRVRRNVSQTELAARMQVLGVNIDQKAVSQIENDRRLVTDYELVCFCRALDCTERELLQDFYDGVDTGINF